MKKLSIILGSALVMLTAGCSKDATEDVVINDKTITLSMNIEGSEDARTSLGEDGYAVLWSAGDCVAVNGVHTTIAEEFAGQSAADFTVSGVVPPYKAIYPAEVLNEDGTITVSEIQEYAPASFAQGAAVMVGYSENTSIKVKNLYGLVKLTIAKSANELIESVTLHSNNLEAMTGTFAVDYENAAITPLAGMDFVKVATADGIAYGADGKAVIYIALPAGKYAKGFTIKVATDKGTMSRSVGKTTGVTIERSKIYTLPELTFKKNSNEADEITDAKQLQAFLDAVNAGDYSAYKNADGEVVLGADIDLTGVTITPAKSFDGVFNGRGYKLKNWTTTNGLFAMNNGTIKNIILDKSCKFTISEDGGTTGFIATESSGTISGCINNANIAYTKASTTIRYIGSIVGSSTGIVVNCTNNGDIEFDFTSVTANNYIGGIVGYTDTNIDGTITVEKCINNGDIRINTTGKPKHIYLGGVIGAGKVAMVTKITTQNFITNCINNGNIIYSYTTGNTGTYANVGGVAGFVPGTIQNCENNGDITFAVPENKQSTRPAIGGVAGCVIYSVTNCINRGTVNISGMFTAGSYDGTATTVPVSGAGGSVQPQFGGIVGSLGKHEHDNTQKMDGCINYGTLSYKILMPVSSRTAPRYGGLAGYSSVTISHCKNYGNMEVTGQGHTNYVGGIVGDARCPISYCQNFGLLSYTGDATTLTDKTKTKYLYIGGIVGDSKSEISNCSLISSKTGTDFLVNSNTFTTRIGGIAGSVDKDVINCTSDWLTEICTDGAAGQIGGLFGSAVKAIKNCTHSGKLSVDLLNNPGQHYIAGIVGYLANTDTIDISDCSNSSTIDVTNGKNTSSFNYIGGISGYNNKVFNLTKSTNTGSITTNCAIKARVGGICGAHSGTMKLCENSGTITMNKATAKDADNASGIGGLSGHIGTDVSDCKNTGPVINNSAAGSLAGGLFGSVGNSQHTWTGCTVACDIRVNDGVLSGILLGGQMSCKKITTVGSDSKPIIINGTTTINGIAVTANDCKDNNKLVGSLVDEKYLKIVSVVFAD